jgi:hypothetical protein
MTESGDLDLVRVVAAQRGPARPVTDAERRYLAGELARRRDWPALWRLAQGLTLAEAIAAVRLIDPGWRPAGEPGRELLARLAEARLDTARPGKPALTTVRIETSGAYVRVGAFSPDVRRFAAVVSGLSGGGAPSWRVCEFELPQGTMVAQHDYRPGRYPEGLLYIGGAIVVAGRRGSLADGRVFLDRFTGSSPDVLAEFPAAMGGLAPYADGFVVLRQNWVRRREAWAGRHRERDTRDGPGELLFCDPHGQTLRRISVWPGVAPVQQVVVDPGSGRLLILGYEVVLCAPLGERVIARSWSPSSKACVCLLGPERFVAGGFQTLQMWHLLGSRLVRQPMRRRVPRDHYVTGIVAVPQRGELAVLMTKGLPEKPVFVRYFDAQTLTEAEGQYGLAGKTGHALWSSAQGSAHALASAGSLDIAFATHPLAPLVGRPMGDMTSSDLVAVAGSLGRHDQFPAERPALELLRACLEYRFGSEVAIGRTRTMARGADEIALSKD